MSEFKININAKAEFGIPKDNEILLKKVYQKKIIEIADLLLVNAGSSTDIILKVAKDREIVFPSSVRFKIVSSEETKDKNVLLEITNEKYNCMISGEKLCIVVL